MSTESHSPDAAMAPGGGRRLRLDREAALELGERYGLVLLFGLVVLWFSVWSETSEIFFTSANLENIIGNQSVLAIVALAAVVPLVAGQFDLSVGAIVGISSVLAATLLSETALPTGLCLVLAVLAGTVVGLVNGLLVARMGINSLITTLGMSTVLGGVAAWVSDSTPIVTGIPQGINDFGTDKSLGLPNTLFVLAVAAFLVWYVLEHTPFGRSLHSVGSSPEAARLVGMKVDGVVLRSFVLSGTIAGAAGILQLARSGAGDPQIGFNFTLPAIAAAFLGATAIKPGRFNVVGTLVAIFFIASATSGLIISGTDPFVEQLFNGGALILGVAVSTVIARQRLRGGQR